MVPPVEISRRVDLPLNASHHEVFEARTWLEDEYWEMRSSIPLTPRSDFDLRKVPGHRSFGWVAHTIV
jgi:hypothetical protein